MHEVNRAVFVRFSRRLAPVQILIPLDARPLQAIERTHQGDGTPELGHLMVTEKTGQVLVNHATLSERRQNHPHST
jgi:hypothetical protein